jgi:hypothetical protein
MSDRTMKWRAVETRLLWSRVYTLEHCRRHLAGQGLSLPRFPGTIYQNHTVSLSYFGCRITVSDLPVPVSRNHLSTQKASHHLQLDAVKYFYSQLSQRI